MAVTRSWAATAPAMMAPAQPHTAVGVAWLVAASLLVAAGIAMAYAGKAQGFAGAERLVNVNTVGSAEELEPLAGAAAPELFAFLERKRPLANIGALAPLRRSAAAAAGAAEAADGGAHAGANSAGRWRNRPGCFSRAFTWWRWCGTGAISAATGRFCRRCTCWRAWGSF